MSAKIRGFIRHNVLGLVAIFIALSGTAYATHPGGANTISSGDIQDNQVRSVDVRDDTLQAGGLQAVDLRADSVGSSEVADDSLGGPDIDEASLAVAQTSGGSGCCEIIGDVLVNSNAYNPFNPDTFIDLGIFELRSPARNDSAGAGFRLCNTGPVGQKVFAYVGGPVSSTADTRSNPIVAAGTCASIDYNGSNTDAFGDFRLHIARDDVVVFGTGAGSAAGGSIHIFAIGQ
jgi:hypothetical protein